MAKYINKYETVAAYEADTQKDYPNVSYIAATDEVVWLEEKPYGERYFTTIALEDGKISNSANTLSYSTDGGQTWSTPGTAPSINVLEGDKIMWKGTKAGKFSSKFNNSKNSLFKVEGNVMSLIYGDDFQGQTTLTQIREMDSLFKDCTGLVSAENLILPATTLTQVCYSQMFYGCTSLTTAPELPATTLVNYCYRQMFQNCSSLTTAPELPATTLAQSCYESMFQNCSSLTTAPELPATTLAQSCYAAMFNGCTSLTKAPKLPATTLAYGCYNLMFSNCTSLATAPELPATTLTGYCYSNMFNGCSSLSSITCLATNNSAGYCTNNWVINVSATGTFTKASNMTGWSTGDGGIPTGWTVVDAQ